VGCVCGKKEVPPPPSPVPDVLSAKEETPRSPEPLSVEEINLRIECPESTEQLTFSNYNLKYAWVSQRGYYPDGNHIFWKLCYMRITIFYL